MPALSNKITSRPEARASVTAGSQLSSVPVKCFRKTRGCAAPPPKRRNSYDSFFTCTNCGSAVMSLGAITKFDILIYFLSATCLALTDCRMFSIRARGRLSSPVQSFLLGSGNRELHHLAAVRDRPVNCVRQFKAHFVWAGREPHKDHRLSACIDCRPGLVIQVVVQVANARRHFQRSLAEHWQNAQVFRPVLNEYPTQGQLFGNRGIDNQFRGRFILNGDERRCPFNVPRSLCSGRERNKENRSADHRSPDCVLGELLCSAELNHDVLPLGSVGLSASGEPFVLIICCHAVNVSWSGAS